MIILSFCCICFSLGTRLLLLLIFCFLLFSSLLGNFSFCWSNCTSIENFISLKITIENWNLCRYLRFYAIECAYFTLISYFCPRLGINFGNIFLLFRSSVSLPSSVFAFLYEYSRLGQDNPQNPFNHSNVYWVLSSYSNISSRTHFDHQVWWFSSSSWQSWD